MRKHRSLASILNIVAATVLGLVFLVPILWMIFTSFKTLGEAMASSSLIPYTWTLENYVQLFSDTGDAPIDRWIINTALVTVAGTLFVVFVDVLAAYSLARLDFPGKKLVLIMIVGALTIPGIVTLFPSFYIFKMLNLTDTYVPLIFPYSAGTLGVFLIYNFLLSFPKELEEAAHLDGANQWRILVSVIFPTVRPAILTLTVITFLNIYNDYLWPLLVVNSPEMKTVTTGLASLIQGANFVNPAKMMASTLIATLPALIIFLFTNRFFVKGVTGSGIK
ncbi:carbohydrate ABC transporter permease [Paenibacillus xerothermodurans]|uniref:Carbohydrate ABC transporter permease n=1 Tax=Paenibacillus xerothermodurans TaxID=1977292 RepID=A0A2W1NM68_PAEXE|nr:carbohydrate ABC transporter permease [Paenibacillus xerothermodurans]PZE20053.1 carbohydrate ABC transporter permease [Paenibacillus xerothermodurans]